MRRTLAILVVGLAAATLRADDGPVTIKVKQPGPGDQVKETKTETTTEKVTVSADGMDTTREETVVTKVVFTDEVVTKPAGAKRPTKLRRTYETADMTRDGKKVDLKLAGRTVVIERRDAGYDLTVGDQPVTGPAVDLLKKEFGRDDQLNEEDLLPTVPVKVGGTWKIDMDKFARGAGGEMVIDSAKSSGTGKLVKVHDKGGRKFGVMEFTLVLAPTKVGPEGKQLDLKAGSKMTITSTVDACIDGSRNESTGKMTVTGSLAGTLMGADVKIDVVSTSAGGTVEVDRK